MWRDQTHATRNLQSFRTSRLRLVAGTAALVRADQSGHEELARLLGAAIPENWPPELVDAEVMEFWLGQLQASPDQAGWWCWYVLLDDGGIDRPRANRRIRIQGASPRKTVLLRPAIPFFPNTRTAGTAPKRCRP